MTFTRRMGHPRVHVPRKVNWKARRRFAQQEAVLQAARDEEASPLKALQEDWVSTLKGRSYFTDLSAGLTVAAVALPLNLALAVGAGLSPTAGLIAGAIGGGLAAMLGGAPLQVTGPAAALNILVLGLVQQLGPAGAAAAAILVGLIQLAMGAFAAGKWIHYVPEAVLAGFTTGVGLKLLEGQLPQVFGVDFGAIFSLKNLSDPAWLQAISWPAFTSGLFVVFFVIACKAYRRFPAALVALAAVTAVTIFLDTPVKRVGAFPALSLAPVFPALSGNQWLELLLQALPLGLLAAAETLLSARALDRMTPKTKRHHSNLELLGQGVANVGSGWLGGMPVTGVIVRSSVNIQAGAKTRLSAFFHAALLLLAGLYLGDLMAKVPLAALAGMLCVIGFRLVEIGTFFDLLKNNRVEALMFTLAAVGTVTGHIMLGLFAALVVHGVHSFFEKKSHAKSAKPGVSQDPGQGIRAAIQSKGKEAHRPHAYVPAERGEQWLSHLQENAYVPQTAFVHPNASVIGRVILGRNVHIAAEASVRADEGTPFYIGNDTNIQDGVVIHGLKKKWVSVGKDKWSVYIGQGVSVAHQALIHGPCFIGDRTFVGFKSVVHDSVLGAGCFVGIGAVVVGVEVPDGKYIPHGSIIDSLEKVNQLPPMTEQHAHFNDDVVEVNQGLASAYRALVDPPKVFPERRPTLVF